MSVYVVPIRLVHVEEDVMTDLPDCNTPGQMCERCKRVVASYQMWRGHRYVQSCAACLTYKERRNINGSLQQKEYEEAQK